MRPLLVSCGRRINRGAFCCSDLRLRRGDKSQSAAVNKCTHLGITRLTERMLSGGIGVTHPVSS